MNTVALGFSLACLFVIAWRIAVLRDRIRTLESCLQELLWVCEQGNFRNGNTHPDHPGGIDEGEVMAYRAITAVREKSGVACPWD